MPIFFIIICMVTAIGVLNGVDWFLNKRPLLYFLKIYAPITLLLCGAVYLWRKCRKTWQLVTAFSIFFGVLLIAWIIYALLSNFNAYIRYGVKSIYAYSSHVSSMEEHARFFPRQIPKNVTHVKFFYRPGFLQGGSSLQLRYTTSREDIEKLYQQFNAIAVKKVAGGDWSKNYNDRGVFTADFNTSDNKNRVFPEDYEVMMLDSSGHWNHGETMGVSISRKSNTIVYWAESW